MSETKVPKDLSPYQKHYSESGFWSKAKSLGKNVLEPALKLYYVMKAPGTPTDVKVKIVCALGYLILPSDLIPDFIIGLGFTDDLAALLMVVKMCDAYITPEIKAQVKAKLNEM